MSGTRSSRVSACLHERGKPAWAAATTHPMVREIAAGTLPHGTFRRYFEQNVLYLGDYARAIGLIIGKAPDLAAVDVLSRFLGQITGTEIPANLAFLERLGGSPAGDEAASGMLPATYAYTRHLLYTSAQVPWAEVYSRCRVYAYVAGSMSSAAPSPAGEPPSLSRKARLAGISVPVICRRNRLRTSAAARSGAFPMISPIARA